MQTKSSTIKPPMQGDVRVQVYTAPSHLDLAQEVRESHSIISRIGTPRQEMQRSDMRPAAVPQRIMLRKALSAVCRVHASKVLGGVLHGKLALTRTTAIGGRGRLEET